MSVRLTKAFGLFLLLLCAAGLAMKTALADPACPDEMVLTNPDDPSQTENARLYGDEFFSFMTDEDGQVFITDKDGDPVYVVKDDQSGYQLGSRVFPLDTFTGTAEERLDIDEDEVDRGGLSALFDLVAAEIDSEEVDELPPAGVKADPLNGYVEKYQKSEITAAPLQAQTPLLILRLEFNNAVPVFSDEEWNARVFGDGISVKDHYRNVSNGKVNYVPAREKYETANDGVIKVKLNMRVPLFQYAKHAVKFGTYYSPDGQSQYKILNASYLFAYAVKAAEPYIDDISSYDVNNDGFISPTELAFLLIYPGCAGSSGGAAVNNQAAIWSHSWSFRYKTDYQTVRIADYENDAPTGYSVRVFKYILVGENVDSGYQYLNPSASGGSGGIQTPIGSVCHELGHDLGLPDLYNTNRSVATPQNVGGLSLMAQGAWGAVSGAQSGSSPVHLDAWCKYMLNFCEPTVMQPNQAVALYTIGSTAHFNTYKITTSDPLVYYLVENRLFADYDRGMARFYRRLPMGGVVVWRVDERLIYPWINNEKNAVNVQPNNYGVMPVFWMEAKAYKGMWIPFWGGRYAPSRPALILRDIPDGQHNTLYFDDVEGTTAYVMLSNAYELDGENDTMCAVPEGTEKYKVIEDENTRYRWARGSAMGLTFRVDGDYANFVSAMVDANTLTRNSEYGVRAGSTVITLYPSYLNTLATGNHTLYVNFNRNGERGYARIVFYVEDGAAVVPRTGDPFQLYALLALMMLAAGMGAGLATRRWFLKRK